MTFKHLSKNLSKKFKNSSKKFVKNFVKKFCNKFRKKNHQKNHQKLVKKSLGTNNLNINDNADFDEEEKSSSPEISFKSMTMFTWGTWCPGRLCDIEKIPLPILDHFLRYFDNYKLKDCQVNFETTWETKNLVCWSPHPTIQDFSVAC